MVRLRESDVPRRNSQFPAKPLSPINHIPSLFGPSHSGQVMFPAETMAQQVIDTSRSGQVVFPAYPSLSKVPARVAQDRR